jgi:DNA-binding CsgD family transcriptional regulator
MPDDLRRLTQTVQELFVGRRQEMDVLRSALDGALAGRGGLVMLVGEPGIGKTRTAQHFAMHAVEHGAQVWWGRCYEEPGAPPFWPWVQALRAYVEAHDTETLRAEMGVGAADMASIIPEVRARLSDLPSPPHFEDAAQARFRLFDSIRSFLQHAAQRQPVVLFLDNLHWADAPSLRLLAFLVPELETNHVLVVGSYRDMDLSRQHPLSNTLGELTRLPRFQRLRLRGLSREDVGRFWEVVFGRPPAPHLLAALHDQTEGNPLFLMEIVRFLVQEGVLTAEGASLSTSRSQGLGHGLRVRIPEGIRDVIGQRLNRLSAPCNGMLSLAAVIGREFSLAELSAILDGGAEEQTLEMLEEAMAARVIEELPQAINRYQFSHALIRETLYDELTTARRARVHRRIGEAMERLYAAQLELHLAQLAYHFAEATASGGADKAIAYAVQAGARSLALLAYEEAVRFYRMALEALELKDPVDAVQRCKLLLVLGEAQRKAGEFPLSVETFQRAADVARMLRSPQDMARAALEFEQATWRAWLPVEPAVRLLREALGQLGREDSALRARTLGGLARALLYSGLQKEAAECSEQAVAMARRIRDLGALAFNLGIMLNMPWQPEESEKRLVYANEMLRLAEATHDLELVSQARNRRMECLLERGEMAAVDAEIEAIARLDAEMRQPSYQFITTGFQVMRQLMDGRFAAAERLAREALRLWQRANVEAGAGVFGVQMFTLCREQGRLRELAPVVQHFVQMHPAASTWRPGLALIYRELGHRQEARAAFEDLAQRDFADLPHDALWAASIAYLTEVCAFLDDAERAATLYRLLLPYDGYNIVAGGGVACYGAASRYLGLLASTMGRWGEAAQHFEAALKLNACMGAKPWLAHTQYDYAAMLLACGQIDDRDRAVALLDEALACTQELGMCALEERITAQLDALAARPPATPDYPADLSSREVEVLRLLALGKSNRDIADILCISLNTVATHVRNILGKTEAANRTEAAAYALHHGLLER